MISVAFMVFPATPAQRPYIQSELLTRIKPVYLPDFIQSCCDL